MPEKLSKLENRISQLPMDGIIDVQLKEVSDVFLRISDNGNGLPEDGLDCLSHTSLRGKRNGPRSGYCEKNCRRAWWSIKVRRFNVF